MSKTPSSVLVQEDEVTNEGTEEKAETTGEEEMFEKAEVTG